MRDPFDEEGDGSWIAYGDFLTTLLGIFLICTVLLIPFINPVAQSSTKGNTTSPGSIIIEAVWAVDNVDVDLWAQAPDDVVVGYSNTRGKVFNLLRDDLGNAYEKVGDRHYENIYSRGTPPGEYVVNLHMFRNSTSIWPIPVTVSITITDDANAKGEPKEVMKSTIALEKVGQEVTIARFRIDQDGNLVPGSVNNLFKPLRAGSP